MALQSTSRLSSSFKPYVHSPASLQSTRSAKSSPQTPFNAGRQPQPHSVPSLDSNPFVRKLQGSDIHRERRRFDKTCCCASLQPDMPGPSQEATNLEAEDAEGLSLQIERLERELDYAINDEDYGKAAELRDQLKTLQEDNVASVVAANKMFYSCFQRGDAKGMARLWAKGDFIGVVHPGANLISGQNDVMASWDLILGSFRTVRVTIELENIQVHVHGKTAVVNCVEIMSGDRVGGRVVATNIYEWHDGRWLMTLHHGSGAAISF